MTYNIFSQVPSEYVAFDLETTGLGFSSKIIQISAVYFKDGTEIGAFDQLINPERPIPAKITQLTGISDADVLFAPTMDQVITNFIQFIQDLPIAGYNSKKFDIPMLRANTGIYLSPLPHIDVLEMARLSPIRTPNYKLTTVKAYYGIQNRAHDSLNDSRATALILEEFRKGNF
ncbi:3'-5' exonuclease [Aerococcus loyolae]